MNPNPWENEPNRVETFANGRELILNRAGDGHWCGYVRLTGDDILINAITIDVHGGITYDETVAENGERWVGFDCGHVNMDYSPYSSTNMMNPSEYKTLGYAMDQAIKMASQL